jgi:hypothetical protein
MHLVVSVVSVLSEALLFTTPMDAVDAFERWSLDHAVMAWKVPVENTTC